MEGLDNFSEREWRLAPRYRSASVMPGVVALNFDELKTIAAEQATEGAFHKMSGDSFGKAPLYIDDLPAALYTLETEHADDFSRNHNTTDNEMLVVVDGVVRLVFNNISERPAADNLDNTYYAGRVVRLQNEAVSMQAVSVLNPAKALALALFCEDDLKIQYRM